MPALIFLPEHVRQRLAKNIEDESSFFRQMAVDVELLNRRIKLLKSIADALDKIFTENTAFDYKFGTTNTNSQATLIDLDSDEVDKDSIGQSTNDTEFTDDDLL
ncbi:uncharacterized protein EI97DRAFT_502796 [Westerdykella ornata]|uniref:Uncharacterized protein n=1 Tax=Westerdykella ornata TaxID=318751 RepID=A0A6A6JGU3_WESOR|nr:uncharacterized protein EI97DRAFT_502796 [Westerdykella ornata]KAF2274439.1 hypothetical protein EI97DRAFT_502796 [Westerdykella ornata]